MDLEEFSAPLREPEFSFGNVWKRLLTHLRDLIWGGSANPFQHPKGGRSPPAFSQFEFLHGKHTNSLKAPSIQVPVPLSSKFCHLTVASWLLPSVTVDGPLIPPICCRDSFTLIFSSFQLFGYAHSRTRHYRRSHGPLNKVSQFMTYLL